MENKAIVLIDSTIDSLTVSWPDDVNVKVKSKSYDSPQTKRYVLQYRHGSKIGNDEPSYETLSNALRAPIARKKNLTDPEGSGFFFRVGYYIGEQQPNDNGNDNDNDESEWMTHDHPFHLLTAEQEQSRMPAPVVKFGGSNESLVISWNAPPTDVSIDASSPPPTTTITTEAPKSSDAPSPSYELQMRENLAGTAWTTISDCLHGIEVRKKNLPSSSHGYQFRVKLSTGLAFSPPSNSVVPLGYAKGLQRLFPDTLLVSNSTDPQQQQPKQQKPAIDVLGGKEFVLLYASAHWCGPCRNFTPKLAAWYQSLGLFHTRTVEIVFLSADHDERSFQSYYADMPWAAIDYDDDCREQLMGHVRVSGIPHLAVLDGRTGKIIESNAVGKPLDVNRWRALV